MQGKTDLSKYDNRWYDPGASFPVRIIWYLFNRAFFISYFPFSSVKIFLLKLFGARIGEGVIIKPHVNIKYPWNLKIENHCWIGEGVWIDSLGRVEIGNNCCISKGALLLSGNHDYKNSTFDLIVREIILEDGVWIGAKSIVCGGVTCKSHAILSAGSVATANLEEYSIYQGNPAVKIRDREITE